MVALPSNLESFKQKRGGIYLQWNTTQPCKDEMLPHVTTWVGLENGMLSEIDQAEKDKNHTISLIGEI